MQLACCNWDDDNLTFGQQLKHGLFLSLDTDSFLPRASRPSDSPVIAFRTSLPPKSTESSPYSKSLCRLLFLSSREPWLKNSLE